MSKEIKNIAVVGAGVMGLNSAWHLIQAGHKVTVYDCTGFPSDSASYAAGGMLAPYSEIEHMSMDWVGAGFKGIDIWEETLRQTNRPVDFAKKGTLLIAHKEDRYVLDRFISHLPQGIDQKQAIDKCEPALKGKFSSGVVLEGEAHIEPREAMEALVQMIEMRGGTLDDSWVEIKDIEDKFDHVIDCRGMGAQAEDPDLRGVKGEMIIVRNPDFELSRPVRLMHPRYPLYIVPRPNHIFMIGATSVETDGDTSVSVRSAMELLSAAYSLDPSFGDAEIVEMSAGIRPSYPDNLPRIRQTGKVISANGMFRHGYLLSPVMGECVAALVSGKEHEHMNLFTGGTHEGDDQRGEQKLRGAA